MTDLPRYSTNAIMMMEIDDDLDNEEQPLATDPEGEWVKWGDVSARLQQLEQENVRLLRALKEREISHPQPAAAADGGEQTASAERRTVGQHSCVVCCAFSTESIDELIAHVRTHESRSADGDAQAMRKPGSGPLRGLDGNVPGDASDSHAGATSHSDRTERTGSLGANDDQVRRPVANDPAGSEPADSLP